LGSLLQEEYVRKAVQGTTDNISWVKGNVLKPQLVDPDNALLCCSVRLFPGDKLDELLLSLVKSLADTVPGLTLQPTKAQALYLVDQLVLKPALHFLEHGMFETKLQGLKLESNGCHSQFRDDADLRTSGFQRLTGYGSSWILSRLGVDYRFWGINGPAPEPDQLPVISQERIVQIATADVLVKEALQLGTQKIMLTFGPGAKMLMLDMPFGWGLHNDAAPCQKQWDEQHWTGEQVVRAINNAKACNLLDAEHVFIGFCARGKIGEISDALQGEGYGRVHTLTFFKVDSSRLVSRASNSH
jgi:hypothetical protein